MKKSVALLLLSSFLLTGCNFFDKFTKKSSSSEEYVDFYEEKYHADDFKEEVEVNPNLLKVTNSKTTVNNETSFSFKFLSSFSIAFRNAKREYLVSIEDEYWSGEFELSDYYYSNGYDGPTEIIEDSDGNKKRVPVFNGIISYVVASRQSQTAYYLPEKMIAEGRFVINITGIGSKALTDKDDYDFDREWLSNYRNEWKENMEIYIPKGIKRIASNAFYHTPESAKIYVERDSIPSGFAPDWTDSTTVFYGSNTYPEEKESARTIKVAGTEEMADEEDRPANFILGMKQSDVFVGEQYDRPLIIQYDLVHSDGSRETRYEDLPLANLVDKSFDSIGKISSTTYKRSKTFHLKTGDSIDENSIYFHNFMRCSDDLTIDTSVIYYAKAKPLYY